MGWDKWDKWEKVEAWDDDGEATVWTTVNVEDITAAPEDITDPPEG